MNKIFNWSIGSFFRTIGRFLAYFVIGLIGALILSGNFNIKEIISNLLFVKVSAEEYNANYNNATYNVCTYNVGSPDTNCTFKSSYTATGTAISYSMPVYVNQFNTRIYGSNNIYFGGNTYQVSITYVLQPTQNRKDMVNWFNTSTVSIALSKTNSASDSSSSFVDSFRFNCSMVEDAENRYTCVYTFTPNDDVNFIRILHTLNQPERFYFTYANVRSDIVITYSNGVSGAIDNQTTVIQNQTDKIVDEQKNTTDAVKDLTDAITDDSSPDLSEMENVAGWLPPGPVDSIITLPLTLLNSVSSALNGTCNEVKLPIPFLTNQYITLPCMSQVYSSMGVDDIMNYIGWVSSTIILFSYLVNLYKWVDNILSLRENADLPGNWGEG